jgi:murein DD-endopeptidase MepM/ murein hydrolase activator NlpD
VWVRIASLVWVLLCAGCATQRPEKLSFEEAFGHRAKKGTPPSIRPASAPPPGSGPAALQGELARFAAAAAVQRQAMARGSAMPPPQQENWVRLVDAVDDFLARPVRGMAPSEVGRARAALEAELAHDAQLWGDFPAPLAEEVLVRVHALAVRMTELRRQQLPPSRPQPAFDWPIEPVIVTSLFGRRLHPIHGVWKDHAGIDLQAYPGQRVSAAAAGVVVRAGWNGAHGRQVEVRHAGGLVTRYSHLSAVLVEPGARVDRGDPVGLAGSSGAATGTHLHFELWRDGRPADPLEVLGQAKVPNA